MSSALLRPGRLIVAALAALSLLLLGQPQAHAASWGSPQTVNSWNTINGRWTANNELETYTPGCVSYEGSTLVIKTYKSGGTYYSGRVESKALYGYGTYSFTANMPNGQGLLPAVWAAYLNPWLPEFDAAEIVGQNPNTVFQTSHDANNTQNQFSKNNSAGWTNAYHKYSFTWWPDHIDFAVDGTITGTKWYTTAPGVGMHFIVNTAVGGDWPGNPNDSTWATSDGARYLKVSSITYTPYFP
ncbi:MULTISPECIES: glycoside hydrolase family 16 protein [unclassified Streptomyces]|uniref:glycoside hydrolase family 16 protein n=1 Tax=unclassified Streptomyces TaxID=2593676 RepID=UPI00225A3C71|nr:MULTISPECIES: glycoside hydrolase family 16 protein [unclassified Streptomyces]MCX5062036.1 glycoside hydrolase family 16 protein [Streptomyces sp. NBC_00452]MCX5249578.1 glycoside hydrolase family 16 protein [Streptomyces sp. NBC_00201]MCX5292355.1 glycoside hydrolase family 16 protein [Streptomyces sp. NBC_00183]